MDKKLLRFFSMLIVFSMVLNMLPVSVFATENQSVGKFPSQSNDLEEKAEDVYIVEEIVENRTEYSKDFKLSNGLSLAMVYSNEVHFQKDGHWEEIDNTLKLAETRSGNVYTNTAGNWQVMFPNQLSGNNSVIINKDGYMLSFRWKGELRDDKNDSLVANTTESIAEQDELCIEEGNDNQEATMFPIEETNATIEESTIPVESMLASEEAVDETTVPTEEHAAIVEDTTFSSDYVVGSEETSSQSTETAISDDTSISEDATIPATESAMETIPQIPEVAEETIASVEETERLKEEKLYERISSAQVQAAQDSKASVEQIDLSEIKQYAKYEEAIVEKNASRLRYENVYENTDIVYDLISNQIKESIIIEQLEDDLLGYSYILEVGDLVPILTENNEVLLYTEEQEALFKMPAPYLFDNAGEYCYDVHVLLEESNGDYVLSYLLPNEWMTDEKRQWPVTLDPIVGTIASNSQAEDQTVYENTSITSNHAASVVNVGYDSSCKSMRTYMRYNTLPSLTSADVIVSASIELLAYEKYGTTTTVEVREVLGSWSESGITWSTQPSYSSYVEDYSICSNPHSYYSWNITNIVRSWYTGNNYGMVFKTTDAQETSKVHSFVRFRSTDYGSTGNPTLSIVYRNNNGLEDYWDYTVSSAGRAGTGYINNYTGNLVWIRNDIGFSGNRMPVTISHVYNANDSQNNIFGMGCGWRTNFNQRVYQWTTDTTYYVWEDSDGTKHYFKYSSAGTYKDEDGLELTLTTTGSGSTKYCISDKYGNCSYFDTYGRLSQQSDNQKTKSSIVINYTTTSGNLISTITDGAGRVYTFTYSSNLLSKISYKGTESSELSHVSFGYTSSNLTSITDKDGKVSQFTYITKTSTTTNTTNNLMSKAQDIDGYTLSYTYNTTEPGLPNRVTTVTEADGSVSGGRLTISYAQNQTTFTDNSGNVQIHQFNNWGNTISIQDDQGRAQYAKYATDTNSSAKGNQLLLSSKLQNTVGNVLDDSSFEGSTLWTTSSQAVSQTITTGTAYHGSKALQLTRSTSGSVASVYSAPFTVAKNETYTFSAYVKTGSATAYLVLNDGSASVDSEVLPANSDWTRLEVSYTANTSAKVVAAHLVVMNVGTVYVDCVQVERAPTASRYNLIQNGDFRHATFWSASSGRTTGTPAAPELSTNVYAMTGSPTGTNHLSQTVAVSGNKGDAYVLAGWAMGNSVPLSGSRAFGMTITFNNTDGTKTEKGISFNPYVENWQYVADRFTAEKNYSSIYITLTYDYNVHTAYFDGIQLYKEEFGNRYEYTDDNKLAKSTDPEGGETKYTYNTTNDLIKVDLPNGGTLSYTYDSYHNVKTATTQTGLVYTYTYDDFGNNLSVKASAGDLSVVSSAQYKDNGNLLSKTTDPSGNQTTYSYNTNTGVLESVTDPAGATTSYTYNTMYQPTLVQAADGKGHTYSASYTYTDDVLTQLQTGSTTYTFTQGAFALNTGVKAGNYQLASYIYRGVNEGGKLDSQQAGNPNQTLSYVRYGNGGTVRYYYDSQYRLKKTSYGREGSSDIDRTVTYAYNNSGELAETVDTTSVQTITDRYLYDFMGRVAVSDRRKNGSSALRIYNQYNEESLMESQRVVMSGADYTLRYTYNTDNTLASLEPGAGQKITLGYDALRRVITAGNKSYTYNTGTTQVKELAYNGISNRRFQYTYDTRGNIATYTDSNGTVTYTYDNLGQLIKAAGTTTYAYSYDDAGNLLTASDGTATHSYTYGDSTWGDLLTAYDGQSITYDGSGNPTSYYNGTRWNLTWKEGRQLATASGGGNSVSYAYDYNGTRMQKTANGVTHFYLYSGSSLVKEYVDGNTLLFYYDQDGHPYALKVNGTLYYYITNLQGDVMGLASASGTVVASYSYDPYGKIVSSSGSTITVNAGAAGTTTARLDQLNPLRYRGYYYDTETGFYYLQSRYYDSKIGRFINADDVDYLGAGSNLPRYNLFAYCGNNPVMGYDPTGHWDWGWEEQVALGATVLIVGLALLLTAPTGGSSLAFGALALSSSTAVPAGSAMAITGTVMVGDAIAASISEANGKPTSRNQMQKQVESGKAPNEVDRVDPPHNDVDNSQNHIHFKDGTAINQDGSLSHKSNGIPNITRAILKWILDNGWSAPKF